MGSTNIKTKVNRSSNRENCVCTCRADVHGAGKKLLCVANTVVVREPERVRKKRAVCSNFLLEWDVHVGPIVVSLAQLRLVYSEEVSANVQMQMAPIWLLILPLIHWP